MESHGNYKSNLKCFRNKIIFSTIQDVALTLWLLCHSADCSKLLRPAHPNPLLDTITFNFTGEIYVLRDKLYILHHLLTNIWKYIYTPLISPWAKTHTAVKGLMQAHGFILPSDEPAQWSVYKTSVPPGPKLVTQQSDEFWSGGTDGFLLRVSRSSSAAASERITALSTDVWGRSFIRSPTSITRIIERQYHLYT